MSKFDVAAYLREGAQRLVPLSLASPAVKAEMIDRMISAFHELADSWEELEAVYAVCLEAEREYQKIPIVWKQTSGSIRIRVEPPVGEGEEK